MKFLIAFLIISLSPIHALAKFGPRKRVIPVKKYKTVGRCVVNGKWACK